MNSITNGKEQQKQKNEEKFPEQTQNHGDKKDWDEQEQVLENHPSGSEEEPFLAQNQKVIAINYLKTKRLAIKLIPE